MEASITEPALPAAKYYIPRPMPVWKFITLSTCTFGIYIGIWNYQQWKFLKSKHNGDLSPFWRAVLSIFFLYPLLAELKREALTHNIEEDVSPGATAVCYALLCFSFRLPAPWELVGFLNVVPLIPSIGLGRKIAEAELGPDRPPSQPIWWEFVIMIVGGGWVVLSVIGSFIH
ncbi:MAG: hypothetical protein JWO30_4049 [Fibrobacteres bacterium]|nr:hypothetical protein [Fibrobacterota bacterium]